MNRDYSHNIKFRRSYEGYPLRLIAYLSLTLVLYSSFEIFCYSLNFESHDYLTFHLRRVADAMLLSLPIWFFSRNWIVFTWIGILILNLNANLIYYSYYQELIPFTSFKLIGTIFVLGDSIINAFSWANIALIILPLFWCLWYDLCKIGIHIRYKERKNRKPIFLSAILFAFAGISMIIPSYLVGSSDRLSGFFSSKPILSFKQFGWINFWIYQLSNIEGLSTQEKVFAYNELASLQDNWTKTQPLIENENKNLILILVESLGSWPIGLEIDGHKVTPNLDNLIAGGSSVYISRMLPQVKHGRSSDAQLMINTGLLPVSNGATASLYAHNDYPSIPKILKKRGYESVSLICEDARRYWNQNATCKAFGFDKLYDNLAGGEFELADESLFSKGFPIVKSLKEPFYAQLVTLSGHDPIRRNLKSKFHNMDFATDEARNIVAIIHYTDSCIGSFIDNLKACGLYDRSIIVVTGDHDGVCRNMFDGRDNTELADRHIPFLMVNVPKGLKADTTLITAQSDIFPSLLDAMGIDDNKWRGLGESIFRPRENGAIYRNMDADGYMTPATAERRKMWKISDTLIRMGWFGD